MNFAKELIIEPDTNVHLEKFDPGFVGKYNKQKAEARVEKNSQRLFKQQYLLYASSDRALLIVLQGMDSSGKDGVIRHVCRGLNPQGCSVTAFKAPSEDEKKRDFLWRIHNHVPAKGNIGIFNRSHYEDVLIVRVRELVEKSEWKQRYDQINDFERMLTENNVTVLKFFLHISKKEQAERLEKRALNPMKNWKFNPNDLRERELWDDYTKAYEAMLEKCSTKHAPWYVIPSDHKWFRNLAVSEIICQTMEEMDLKLPRPEYDLSKIKID